MKRITTVISGTGKYVICKNEHGYWAIEHGYLGDDGRLKKPINGVQGHLRNTLKDAVEAALFNGKVKEFRENNPNTTDELLLRFMASIV
jgi:hypothetical protein